MTMVNVDVAHGAEFDLTDELVVAKFRTLAESGYFDGGHGGPPCSTWSVVRFKPGGPGPLRFRDSPWGRDELSPQDQRRVDDANRILVATMMILKAIVKSGGFASLEHPRDPGTHPYPSIWNLSIMQNWEEECGMERTHFLQCMWGCMAPKATTITSNVPGISDLCVPCNHTRHLQKLHGVDASGKFRSRTTQAYPTQLCQKIASVFIASFKNDEERGANRLLDDAYLDHVITKMDDMTTTEITLSSPSPRKTHQMTMGIPDNFLRAQG